MQKFNVMVFDRKRDAGAGGRIVEHKGKMVSEDSLLKKLPSFTVTAPNHDVAKRAAKEKIERDGRVVAGVSFSGEAENGLIVYVFAKD